MPTLPAVMVTLLLPFERLFDPRTWRKAQLLAMGAILSPGKRTVSSALNILGIGQHGDFAVYHHVLNRAQWSPLQLSRVLSLLVAGRLGSSTEPLVFGIDETVERRWGRKIAAKGRYRDPVRSKDDQVVMTPGLQWVSLLLLTRIGWGGRHWALPFLTALVVSARYDRRKGRRHKTVTDYAQQMLVCLRRWLPDRDLVVVADGGYAKREFLRHCQNMSKPIVVVTKLRKDASRYRPAPSHTLGRHQIPGGAPRALCFAMHRHRGGTPADTAVVSAAVAGRGDPVSSTRCRLFEELRAHLGMETQRQWSERAIARTTPALFGRFSVVTLAADILIEQRGAMAPRTAAWYDKTSPSFADAIALVRRHLWVQQGTFMPSEREHESIKVPRLLYHRMLDTLAYAA